MASAVHKVTGLGLGVPLWW